MRRIKAAFDPQNLFNPGKVFAGVEGCFPPRPALAGRGSG